MKNKKSIFLLALLVLVILIGYPNLFLFNNNLQINLTDCDYFDLSDTKEELLRLTSIQINRDERLYRKLKTSLVENRALVKTKKRIKTLRSKQIELISNLPIKYINVPTILIAR